MNFSEIFDIVKQLISDWRIITAFVIVFLYLNFIFYVSRYRRRPAIKRQIIKKKITPEETQETPPTTEENS